MRYKTELNVRRSGKRYRAEDYDDEGNLKAPLWMWAGVVWLLLPWWLTVVGIVSHDTPSVAEALYPTVPDMVISLVAALPVGLLCAVYPLRGRYPRVSLLTYGAVFAGLVVEVLRAGSVMLRLTGRGDDDTELLLSCLCVDFAALAGMLLTSRLWTVFGWRN
ncbi:DUF2919 domain-containing protein [Salmonella enterica subsp. enterica]|uniref:DUF2919 family protein n=1 Tax=Salmonella enterica subsp. enterica serovar Aqua TaxID=1302615 RepID=A0A5X6ERQ5_SALET|nr:DUF2919 family protein [Salmonella enterica subsp. enterica serovar Aqua]ECH1172025.1 DUF2919 domain-containing protein [Salmonella enterica subsp. enterica serovar Aqua]HCM8928197.1 DUF2919 family protein [Salmonella enterica subsp. enterica serovar Paratyphi B]